MTSPLRPGRPGASTGAVSHVVRVSGARRRGLGRCGDPQQRRARVNDVWEAAAIRRCSGEEGLSPLPDFGPRFRPFPRSCAAGPSRCFCGGSRLLRRRFTWGRGAWQPALLARPERLPCPDVVPVSLPVPFPPPPEFPAFILCCSRASSGLAGLPCH